MEVKQVLRCAALALVLPLHCMAASVSLGATPLDATLAPGETTFVDLSASFDGDGSLLGGAVSLSFRADLLEVVGVTLLAPSDVAGTIGGIVLNGTEGVVEGIGFATFAGVAGSFDLARVEFRAIGLGGGTSPLLAYDAADPVFAWVNEGFDSVNVLSAGSEIVVSAIPEPLSAMTMVTGLLLLITLRQWRHRHGSANLGHDPYAALNGPGAGGGRPRSSRRS